MTKMVMMQGLKRFLSQNWKRVLSKAVLLLSIVGVCYLFLYIATGVQTVAKDVLSSLVDANVGLLGFLGIITVFALSTYRDSVHRTEDELRHSRLGRRESERLQTRLERLRTKSEEAYSLAFNSAVWFVFSIFLCILAMSDVISIIKLVSAYLAFGFILVGLAQIFDMISGLKATIE